MIDHSNLLLPMKILQGDLAGWVQRNFGPRPSYQPLLGAMEELGELAHAHLKGEQGIRQGSIKGNAEDLAKDAVADVVFFLMDYASANGWDFGELLLKTWSEVRTRDWKAYPETGGKPSDPL